MKPEPEHRPFLSYTDDAAAAGTITHKPARQSPMRTNRLARDALVFLIASVLWIGALFVLVPLAPTTAPAPPPPQTTTPQDYRTHNVTSNARFVSCGTSTAEARSNGCAYDTLLNHWVPKACWDQEWIDEYEDDGSNAAFADVNLTQRLSPETIGDRDYYYTSIRDHVNHCAIMWKKQFWALFEARRAFDAVIVNFYHTEHCASFLSETMTMNRTEPTLVKIGFSGCWIKDQDEL